MEVLDFVLGLFSEVFWEFLKCLVAIVWEALSKER
jgi:hypothetical protein